MDENIVEDEDFQRINTQWKPLEWISCGREYKDLPFHVSIEVQRARRMSAEMEATLPSPLYSPADFHLQASLPEWKESYDAWEEDDDLFAGTIAFHEQQPTSDASVLAEVPLLSKRTIQRLDREFGQAFLDGKLSVRDARDEKCILFLPLSFVSYASRMREAVKIWHTWNNALAWMREPRDKEEPEECIWRERAHTFLTSITGWGGRVGCGLGDLTFERLAEVLGDNWLSDSVEDALVRDIKTRLNARYGASNDVLLADTFFATYVRTGAATDSAHVGHSLVQKYTHMLTSPSPPQSLYFPLYSPPVHWASCKIDLQNHLADELVVWLVSKIGLMNVQITNDLPCGRQNDSFNCGIIATNAVAHDILGDDLWDSRYARTHRYRAFCIIAAMIQKYQEDNRVLIEIKTNKSGSLLPFIEMDQPATAQAEQGVVNDMEMEDVSHWQADTRIGDTDLAALVGYLEEEDADADRPSVPEKRKRKNGAGGDDNDAPARKRTKEAQPTTSTSSTCKQPSTVKEKKALASEIGASPAPRISCRTSRPEIPYEVQHEIKRTLRDGGQSDSARHDRAIGVLIKWSLYRGNEKRLEKLRKECTRDGGDPNPGLDINNPKQVVCSRCHKAVQLKAVYEAGRFRDHWNKGACKQSRATQAGQNFCRIYTGAQGGAGPLSRDQTLSEWSLLAPRTCISPLFAISMSPRALYTALLGPHTDVNGKSTDNERHSRTRQSLAEGCARTRKGDLS
ncbi:hypothetical protein GGX14DRAFT_391721 [Mycena pura]|uniref:Ubiquitin-like protease family profile domain-containing protein n=1 Tax=Mycena pura TaxID=153505 RepID=A0AAD6YGN4_9AGAR|nr:hypothetical protein GGX14DRAFT_391721 [Mycena pura]